MKTRSEILLAIAMVVCLNTDKNAQAHDLFPPPYRGLASHRGGGI